MRTSEVSGKPRAKNGRSGPRSSVTTQLACDEPVRSRGRLTLRQIAAGAERATEMICRHRINYPHKYIVLRGTAWSYETKIKP